jgi:superfamily II DNA or RNA helicase
MTPQNSSVTNGTFAVGSLIRARAREWVVLPGSSEELILARPLGGTEDEVAGIDTILETVSPATFTLPDPTQVGDYRSARLLRDAVRLGFRSSAGPFRSFARINCEPRPYQLVPLLMALKLDPVRLLIADDVGIGKTIEALLIARELLDRGEIARIAVLCPPPLAEQWQAEMRDKFYIDAELVLPSTANRLEKSLMMGESLFDHYPFVVVSTDFIKSERRRGEFLRACPEFVIVDEAHSVAHTLDKRGGKHQRYDLISGLSKDETRHLILVTATPHSGKEQAFRSLLALINPSFADMPEDLSGAENERFRRDLARYLVQRRRADIRAYMDADTPFPEREYLNPEPTYKLSSDYHRLFERVLSYAREIVTEPGTGYRQRIRWWSALALLRSLASSPAAAAATLRARAATTEAESLEAVDEIGQRTVFDLMNDESGEGADAIPGSDISSLETDEGTGQNVRRRLLDMATAADKLQGAQDLKLQGAIQLTRELLKDGYHPILFCRFIPTVDYVTAALRDSLRGVDVVGVTGLLPPAEREDRIAELIQSPKRVLVCTDCLSEGVNLQAGFDAVLHYDLSWNPTRHEQREGRVDRYGQPSPKVKMITYYGVDNQIDGIVLDVLLRKHRAIRDRLGISVPIPGDNSQLVDAIFEGLLLRETASFSAQLLPILDEYLKPNQLALDLNWEKAADQEKRTRTLFAQGSIKVEEVASELSAAHEAIGSGVQVAEFLSDAVRIHGGTVSGTEKLTVNLTETPRGLRESVGTTQFVGRFALPIKDGETYLTRNHPIIEAMASYVMDSALDPVEDSKARRCGVIRTSAVSRRTTVLLVRFRFHLITRTDTSETPLMAEDCRLVAFTGAPDAAEWLDEATADALLTAQPDENIDPEQASDFVGRVVDGFDAIAPYLATLAQKRAETLLAAHRRVRTASKTRGVRYSVEPQLPPDVLGIYVYLPNNNTRR